MQISKGCTENVNISDFANKISLNIVMIKILNNRHKIRVSNNFFLMILKSS